MSRSPLYRCFRPSTASRCSPSTKTGSRFQAPDTHPHRRGAGLPPSPHAARRPVENRHDCVRRMPGFPLGYRRRKSTTSPMWTGRSAASSRYPPTVPFRLGDRRFDRHQAAVGGGLASGTAGSVSDEAELASLKTVEVMRGGVRHHLEEIPSIDSTGRRKRCGFRLSMI